MINLDAGRPAAPGRLATLDAKPEPAFDTLARLVQAAFQSPYVLIFVRDGERRWLQAHIGFGPEAPEAYLALCDQVLAAGGDLCVVEDMRLDARFWNDPLVARDPCIRFYAAAPLFIDGATVGALCLFDPSPKYDFGVAQRVALQASAAAVEELLRLRIEMGERRSREAALEVAHRKMALAEELGGVGHWTFDPASGSVAWSRQVYLIHGLDPDKFHHQLGNVLELYEEDSRHLVAAHVNRALTTGEGFAFKLRIVRVSDGAVRTVMARAEMAQAEGRPLLIGAFQDVTDQDILLQQVTEDRERYKLLTQNATDVIATYTSDGTITFISPAIETLAGRTSLDLVGRKTYELIHPDDHKRVTRAFRTLVKSGAASTRIEYRLLRLDAEPLWVEAHPSPIFDSTGALTGFQDVVRDVSARRAAEIAAADSELRYRLLAENANDMIALTSPVDSRILYVSPGCSRVLGYTPDELMGRPTLSLTHPEDRATVVRIFNALREAGPSETATPYQFRGLHKNGSWVWLEGQPRVQFDESGAPTQFQDVVRDISARKAAEDAAQKAARISEGARALARASEQRYRLLAENATDMISKYGLDGTISFVSPACEQVIGYSAEELIGRKTTELIHPDDAARIRDQFADYVASSEPTGSAMKTRHRVVCKNGDVVWVEGRPVLIRSETGTPLEFYDVMRDITEQVQLELELEAARKAAETAASAKSDFLANMSHELRTPLTGILGYADVLAASSGLPAPSRRYAELIRRSGKHLLTLVNDVLDLSKIQASGVGLAPQAVELRKLMSGTLDLIRPQAAAKGLRLQPDLPRQHVLVEVDPDRLRQVVVNLLGNAIKFTQAGEVGLSLTAAPSTPGRVAVCIGVKDSGIGMTPDQVAQVFGRFEQADASITRRFGGTGLGLSISLAIIATMKGDIRVESVEGRGSTFTVLLDLPTADAPSMAPPAAKPTGPSPLRGKTVLLAEDVAMNRELIEIFLSPHDVAVVGVENGAQAVDAASREAFDLILMDMQMPVLDGLEAARRIRASDGPCKTTPILALTANVLPDEIVKCRTAGMNGHISKPFNVESLIAGMETALMAEIGT